MATTIYLPSSGSAAVTPTTWNFPFQAAATYTLAGALTKGTTAFTSRTTATGTTSPRFTSVMRYVIGPLAATQIAGTVNLVMRCNESNAGANATLALAVKLITPAGADRSVLLAYTASDLASSPYEMQASLNNCRAYSASEARPITLTAQTPTSGDYLVVEIGFRSATTTTRNVIIRHGDNSANDLADADSGTNDYAPWVMFSQSLPFIWNLSTNEGSIDGVGDAAGITQAHMVGANDGAVVLAGDSPEIEVQSAINLTTDEGACFVYGDSAPLTQAHAFTVLGGAVLLSGDSPVFFQAHGLSWFGGGIGLFGDDPPITQGQNVTADPGWIGLFGDAAQNDGGTETSEAKRMREYYTISLDC